MPWLSRRLPVILTLHDAWLLSGHCAHSLGCDRWKTGCGQCPDLTLEPAIQRDATASNWSRKRRILSESRLRIATPSRWLMGKVQRSFLASSLLESRVISNGVDLNVFRVGNRRAARSRMAIPQDTAVLLFAAYKLRQNMWKDYQTIQAAVTRVARALEGKPAVFLALGQYAPPERIENVEIRYIPFQSDPTIVAAYYQAADVYIHAALADTFPNTILEALACGTPVVATATGGIPEQIIEGQSGFLVAPRDAEALSARVMELLDDEPRRSKMSREATRDARQRFDLERQADAYLDWYRDLVGVEAATFAAGSRHEVSIS